MKRESSRPLTGSEYLESIRDEREVWIYGERVKDVTIHPGFRNAARMIARMYDSLHDPAKKDVLTTPTDTGNGGFTHKYYKVSRTVEELVGARDAIAEWARIGYGWMGRAPDYKASLTGTLAGNPDYFAPYQKNALHWYREVQENCWYLNHALINPPVDKNLPPDQVGDVFVRVEKETDAGVVASGAKVVATGSALTHYNFIGFYGPTPLGRKDMALFAMLKMDTPGVKLICRPSYEMQAAVMGSPFDYPLSSRLDENDAVLVLDKVLIPWENLFVYGDLDKANGFLAASGWPPRFVLHGCTRFAVKLDFLAGLLLKAVEITGSKEMRGVQVRVGEVLAWRHLFWAITEAMVRAPETLNGLPWPNSTYMHAYRVFATVAYPRIKEIIEQDVSSALIYLSSSGRDFDVPELRPLLDRYYRGANGVDAMTRSKVLKLLWDAVGTEFGGRHELYERNYAGNHENIRLETLLLGEASGLTKTLKGFVDQCLGEYDVNGWTAKDLINPDDVNFFTNRRGSQP